VQKSWNCFLFATRKREIRHAKPAKLFWSACILSICWTSLVHSQGQFRAPNIPPPKTIDGQPIGTRQPGRFGLNPNLTSSQSEDFGVRQSTSLPQSRVVQPAAPLPDFVRPQADSPGLDNQDPGRLESIEGMEAYPNEINQEQSVGPPALSRFENRQSADGREVIVQRYPDGKPQIEREVAQDEEGNFYNHGFWNVYSQKGNIIAKGQYRDGEMDGLWERQHNKESSGLFSTKPFSLFQGPFTSTATFKNNTLDGMWTLTDHYERKIFEVPYSDGQRNGTATWWYPTMNKMREVTFENGTIDGQLLEWDEQNKLTRDETFLEGKKIIHEVTFYRPKQKETEKFFLDAKLEIEGQDNWWDAQPAPIVTAGKKLQHGRTLSWYDNGLPKMKGQYVDGNRVGRFTWWHANGNKQLEGEYERGTKIDVWTWRHENGMKAIEGNYENGRAVEIWRWWQPDGKIEAEEDLSLARPPGSESGSLNNPAQLPEGIPEPIQIHPPAKTDENHVPSMIESRDLEGIEPLDRDDDSSLNFDDGTFPDAFFADG
jgi:antitoxin component YwqK of YwqJK toxin-antitoxin module